jgi:hypothetical protein
LLHRVHGFEDHQCMPNVTRLLDQVAVVFAGSQRVVREGSWIRQGDRVRWVVPSRNRSPGISTTSCHFTRCEASVKALSEGGGTRYQGSTSLAWRIEGGAISSSPRFKSSAASSMPWSASAMAM